MRNCGQIIERAIKRQGVKQKDIADFLEMAPQNMSKIIRKETMDAATLEKICEYLRLDPADFFDYRPDYAGSGIRIRDIEQTTLLGSPHVALASGDRSGQTAEEALIAAKDSLIAAKDALIAEKDRHIEALEQLIGLLRPQGQSAQSEADRIRTADSRQAPCP